MNIPPSRIPIVGLNKTKITVEIDNTTGQLFLTNEPEMMDYAKAVLMLTGAIQFYTQSVLQNVAKQQAEATAVAKSVVN